MRRMYSEQELTKIIGEVFDAKIEAGAFDDSISDAVDAYLVEHPVDITALEGLDISVGSLTSTGAVNAASLVLSGNASVGGNLSVTGNASIFDKIVDSAGNKRFLEGSISTQTITGVTYEYAKWALSGTHLTIVVAGKIDAGESFPSPNAIIATLTLPAWVAAKIYPVRMTGEVSGYVEAKNIALSSTGYDLASSFTAFLYKHTATDFQIFAWHFTAEAEDVYFRVQFDLLIDSD